MAKAVTDTAYYAAIADAIRAKNGDTTAVYTPAQMAPAILALPAGADVFRYSTDFSTKGSDWTYYGSSTASQEITFGEDGMKLVKMPTHARGSSTWRDAGISIPLSSLGQARSFTLTIELEVALSNGQVGGMEMELYDTSSSVALAYQLYRVSTTGNAASTLTAITSNGSTKTAFEGSNSAYNAQGIATLFLSYSYESGTLAWTFTKGDVTLSNSAQYSLNPVSSLIIYMLARTTGSIPSIDRVQSLQINAVY